MAIEMTLTVLLWISDNSKQDSNKKALMGLHT